jgi:hypothetical protein
MRALYFDNGARVYNLLESGLTYPLLRLQLKNTGAMAESADAADLKYYKRHTTRNRQMYGVRRGSIPYIAIIKVNKKSEF